MIRSTSPARAAAVARASMLQSILFRLNWKKLRNQKDVNVGSDKAQSKPLFSFLRKFLKLSCNLYPPVKSGLVGYLYGNAKQANACRSGTHPTHETRGSRGQKCLQVERPWRIGSLYPHLSEGVLNHCTTYLQSSLVSQSHSTRLAGVGIERNHKGGGSLKANTHKSNLWAQGRQ